MINRCNAVTAESFVPAQGGRSVCRRWTGGTVRSHGAAAWLASGALLCAAGCTMRPAEPGDTPWSTRDLSRPSVAQTEDGAAAQRGATPAPSSPVEPEMTRRTDRRAAREQQEPAVPVATRVRERAIGLLRRASESTNDQIRVHAVEAMQYAPDHLESVIRAGLGDANRGVRFASAMTVGKLTLTHMAHLAEPLVDDPSESVRIAAIYAMHRCGRPVSLDPLAEMLRSSDPEVKGNAVMVLGELGNPSAIPMLREAARSHSRRMSMNRQRVIDLQIAEAMVRLGNEDHLDVIRAALFAPAEQGEFAALACMIAGRLHDEAYGSALLDMAVREGRDARPAEVRLAAAAALAEMHPERAPVHVPMHFVRHENYLIRAQAAWSLGAFPDPSVVPLLETLMEESNALVQVSAAGALLRWLSRFEGTLLPVQIAR